MNLEEIKTAVSEVMAIDESGTVGGLPYFKGQLRTTPAEAASRLREDLEAFQLLPMLSREGDAVKVRTGHLSKPGESRGHTVNLVLFLLTILSTLLIGSLFAGGNPFAHPLDLLKGFPFSISILLILGSHELGHFFVSKRNGVETSLPYFLPVPTLFGTMGAIIKQRSPFPNRGTLMRIGAAGPLTGLAFAVPIAAIGLRLSQAVPVSEIPEVGTLSMGDSLLFSLLIKVSIAVPHGHQVSVHPVAFAGWAGIFVTGLNLLPIGQLDGGHVAYAALGRYHRWIQVMAVLGLFLLGLLVWRYWWVIGIVYFVLVGPRHPHPVDEITPLSFKDRVLGFLCLAAFALAFTPIPIA